MVGVTASASGLEHATSCVHGSGGVTLAPLTGSTKGDPATSVKVALLPTENTEIEPGTGFPELSLVALLATKRSLPAESILRATGVTGTNSVVFCPPTKTVTCALLREYVVALPSLPSEAMGNVAIPVTLPPGTAGFCVTMT